MSVDQRKENREKVGRQRFMGQQREAFVENEYGDRSRRSNEMNESNEPEEQEEGVYGSWQPLLLLLQR